MKTVKEKKRIKTKTIQKLMVALMVLGVLTSCSKDDDGDGSSSSISATASSFSIDGINNCSTSIGAGTRLLFDTPYTTSQGLTVERMLIKTTVSNGESKDDVNTNFTDTDSSIVWSSCFTYGSQDWVEYEVRLEASDGSVSNVSKVRVNKPSGAN